MELFRLKDIQLIFYEAVNKLITDEMQNLFYLKAEHSSFIKYC